MICAMIFTLGVMAILLKCVKTFYGNFHAIAVLYCQPNLRFFPEKIFTHFRKMAITPKIKIIACIMISQIKDNK